MPRRVDWYSRRMVNNTQIGLYPVNALRNAAVDHAWTNWVFPCAAVSAFGNPLDRLPSARSHTTSRAAMHDASVHGSAAAVSHPLRCAHGCGLLTRSLETRRYALPTSIHMTSSGDVDFVPSTSLYRTFRQLHAPALLHVNRAAVR